jgi:hypothetical protein
MSKHVAYSSVNCVKRRAVRNQASFVEKQLRLYPQARKNILSFVSKAVKSVGRPGNLRRRRPDTLPDAVACRFETKLFKSLSFESSKTNK